MRVGDLRNGRSRKLVGMIVGGGGLLRGNEGLDGGGWCERDIE